MPGSFSLIFSAGKIFSQKTVPFQLLNKITKVTLLRNPKSEIKVLLFMILIIIKLNKAK